MDGRSPIRGARLQRFGMTVTITADVAAASEPVPGVPYYADVLVKIVAVDLDKETVRLQLECVPHGRALLDPENGGLKYPLVITSGVSASGIGRKKIIPAGDAGGITTVGLDLDETWRTIRGIATPPLSG